MMKQALKIAEAAGKAGEVPVGALIVKDNHIITQASNRVEQDHDPTAHAEILALRQASQILGTSYLDDCDLYVTLEPCAMCAGAIALSRIRRLYFGAYDPKSGGVDHGARVFDHPTCHHHPQVYGGIEEEACRQLLQRFFQDRR